MKRREFIGIITGMATAWPFAARAQQAAARIALLGSGSAATSGVFVDAFKEGLREHGLIEGQHYVLDARWAEGAYARFPQLAGELAAQRPRVIMVTTIAAVRAAQRVAPDIPIVMTSINDASRRWLGGEPGTARWQHHGLGKHDGGSDAEGGRYPSRRGPEGCADRRPL